MTESRITVRVSMPAIPKVDDVALRCGSCGGIGLKVRRTYRRRNGHISKIVYDLDNPCSACGGTGLK